MRAAKIWGKISGNFTMHRESSLHLKERKKNAPLRELLLIWGRYYLMMLERIQRFWFWMIWTIIGTKSLRQLEIAIAIVCAWPKIFAVFCKYTVYLETLLSCSSSVFTVEICMICVDNCRRNLYSQLVMISCCRHSEALDSLQMICLMLP